MQNGLRLLIYFFENNKRRTFMKLTLIDTNPLPIRNSHVKEMTGNMNGRRLKVLEKGD